MDKLTTDKSLKKTTIRLLTGLSIASLALTACGQKGDLYLPHTNQQPPSQPNQGHEQDKFIIPQNSSHTPQEDKLIQQRIEEMQANPNDF